MPEDEMELVMPFVVCASQGGPYDDQAFVAGYEMGQLDAFLCGAALTLGTLSVQRTIREASVPQADLIALKHDYTMTVEPVGDEWALATFNRARIDGQATDG